MNLKIPVIVKDGNNTYTAKVIGSPKLKCSCTAGADQAAESLCRKYWPSTARIRPATTADRHLEPYFPGSQRPTKRVLTQILTDMTHVIEV